MEATQVQLIPKQNLSLKGKLKGHILSWLRLTDQPTVKVYRSFGNAQQLTIHGSALKRSALPRIKYRSSLWVNLFGLIRLFLVQPYPRATVQVVVDGQSVDTQSDTDGYFRVDVPLSKPLASGWHTIRVKLLTDEVSAEGEGQVLVPDPTPFVCISDIDDTFLVSHSANLLKRLNVLITKNAHTRAPFEGVVAHYQLLAQANSGPNATNAFFYVSSSEWNLYDYIIDFSKKNGLPTGVYLLSPLKRLAEVLKTGQGKHMTKFMRIVRILEMYPQQQFVLLGDDTQEDPTIYASVAEHFPTQIRCVYIRQVRAKNKLKTEAILKRIEALGIPYCYFAHSADAQKHSIDIGLVAS
ncbi:App1 family protein [Spirosoma gilvum]